MDRPGQHRPLPVRRTPIPRAAATCWPSATRCGTARGKQLWSNDQTLQQHADSVFVGNITGDETAPPMVYWCGSDEGIVLLDHRGVIRRQYRVGHAQTACIGKFRPDLAGPAVRRRSTSGGTRASSRCSTRAATSSQQDEPIHSGSPMLPVNWRGDGQEFILLSGNVREGGMVDGNFRRVVMFPDDGHPDLCAAVHEPHRRPARRNRPLEPGRSVDLHAGRAIRKVGQPSRAWR